MSSNKAILYNFNPEEINWKFKVTRSNRRMKLYIKMTKAETVQYEELASAAKPPEMSDDQFAKILFYKGIDSFMSQLSEHIHNMPKEDRDKLVEEANGETEPTREEIAALGKKPFTDEDSNDTGS